MDSVNLTTQAYAIYIKMEGDGTPFMWAGRKASLGEIKTPFGAVTTTTAFDPRGGLYKDGTLVAEPAEVTTELTIKHEQHSRMRSMFLNRRFTIDKRAHIDGKDKDSPTKWIDIERVVNSRITDRTTSATMHKGEEESLITLPISAQSNVDIYRTAYSEVTLATLASSINSMTIAEKAKAGNNGLIYAVVEINLGVTELTLLVNRNGGAFADWEVITLTGITDVPKGIQGFGNTVCILTADSIFRSDTYGSAFSVVKPTGWVNMIAIFGLDQTAMFAVGEKGLVSRSNDGGRSWNTSLNANTVTVEDLLGGYVVDERVIYTYGENGTLLRTNNFGKSWYAITTPEPTESIIGFTAPSRDEFVYITNTGSVYNSYDGGTTITKQASLEGLPDAGGGYDNATLVQDGSGVYFLMVNASVATESSFIYRNIDNGSSGYWYQPTGEDAVRGSVLTSGGMVDTNTFIAVGGNQLGDENVISSIQ